MLVACVYPSDLDLDVTRVVARAPGDALGLITIIDLVDAITNGFADVLPFEYVDGEGNVVEIRQYLGEGQTLADFDAVQLCGEVLGICESTTDSDAVDENGEPCVPPDEVGGVIEEPLPDTGGPAGMLVPLGALLVLLGAGLVMVRRPHTA